MSLGPGFLTAADVDEAERLLDQQRHEQECRSVALPPRLIEYTRPGELDRWKRELAQLRTSRATPTAEKRIRLFLSDLEVYPTRCHKEKRLCPPARLVWMAPHMQATNTTDESYNRAYFWELKKYKSWVQQLGSHMDYLALVRSAWPFLAPEKCTWYANQWVPAEFHTCHICARVSKFRDEVLAPFLKDIELAWVLARERDDIVGAMQDGLWPSLIRGAMVRFVAMSADTWFSVIAKELDYEPRMAALTLRDVLFKNHWSDLGDLNGFCKNWLDSSGVHHLFPLTPNTRGADVGVLQLTHAPFPWPGALDTSLLFRDISLNGDAASAERELELNLPREWQDTPISRLSHGQWSLFFRLIWRHQRHVERTPLLEFLRTVVFLRALGRALWQLDEAGGLPERTDFETFDANQMSYDPDRKDLADPYLCSVEIMLVHWIHTLLLQRTFASNTAVFLSPDLRRAEVRPGRMDHGTQNILSRLERDPAYFIPTERECVEWALALYQVILANRAVQREKGGCSSDPLLEGIQAVGLGYLLKPGDVSSYIASKTTSVQRVHFEILRDRQPDAWAIILLLNYHPRLLEYTTLRATPLTQTMNSESQDPVIRQARHRVVKMFKDLQANASLIRELEPEGNAILLRRAYLELFPVVFSELSRFEEMRMNAETNSLTMQDLQSAAGASSRSESNIAQLLQELEKLSLDAEERIRHITERVPPPQPLNPQEALIDPEMYDPDQVLREGIARNFLERETPDVQRKRLIQARLSAASAFDAAPLHSFSRDYLLAHFAMRCYGQVSEMDEQKHFKFLRGAASPISFVDICHPRESPVSADPTKPEPKIPGIVRAAQLDKSQTFLLYLDGEYWLRWGPVFAITRHLQVALKLRSALAHCHPLDPSGQFNPLWVDPITRGFAPWMQPPS